MASLNKSVLPGLLSTALHVGLQLLDTQHRQVHHCLLCLLCAELTNECHFKKSVCLPIKTQMQYALSQPETTSAAFWNATGRINWFKGGNLTLDCAQ